MTIFDRQDRDTFRDILTLLSWPFRFIKARQTRKKRGRRKVTEQHDLAIIRKRDWRKGSERR